MRVRQAASVLGVGVVWLALACSGGGGVDYTGGTQPTTPTSPYPSAQPGAVQGAVLDSAGAGVSGAGLSLAASGQTTLSATSGTDGHFSFSQVAPGNWTLTLTAPTGFAPAAESVVTVSVTANQTSSVNFTVKKPPTSPPPPAADASVTISGFAFSPVSLTVARGSTVSWTNKDAVTHTATADDGSFDTSDLGTNGSGAIKFNTAGTYAYHCQIHPTMKATIIVQ